MENNGKKETKESSAEELMNEGLGNKEKFKDDNVREEVDGEIDEEDVESIENAESDEKEN